MAKQWKMYKKVSVKVNEKTFNPAAFFKRTMESVRKNSWVFEARLTKFFGAFEENFSDLYEKLKSSDSFI